MTTAAPAHELAQGFEAFVAASRRLERSYAALKKRADAVDIELASTNRALQQALEEKEAILGALPVGVLAVTQDQRVQWANPEGRRLAAATADAGLDLARAAEDEHVSAGLTLAVRRVPLQDGRGLVVVEDRSPLVRLTREVDRLDRLAGLSELALGIAHEIKNPLNGVMGFAALLERARDPDAMRRHAGKMMLGLQQVDEIVREMLAFARSPGSAGALVAVGEIVAEAAAAAGVPRACITMHGDAGARVACAPLVRVLANLFRNSAEAVEGDLVIRIDCETRRGQVEMRVEDSGPGVSAELGAKVFEPFVSTKGRGSGLGLALASRVIAFLGGTLELVAPVGTGACFRLVVPSMARNSMSPEVGDE